VKFEELSTTKNLNCPVCRRPFNPDTTRAMPFCSERCRLVDLKRWLGEEYGMPREESEEIE